jgi:hypothetical protein
MFGPRPNPLIHRLKSRVQTPLVPTIADQDLSPPIATGENRIPCFLHDGYLLRHSPHLLLLSVQLQPSPRRILIRLDAVVGELPLDAVKEEARDLLTDASCGGWRRMDADVAGVALQGRISAQVAGVRLRRLLRREVT